MTLIANKTGFDIKMAGRPSPDLAHAAASQTVTVQPRESAGIKIRLNVKEGDKVKRGTVLYSCKRNDAFKYRSPAGGTVESIVRGARRFPEKIVIRIDGAEDEETFTAYTADQIAGIPGSDVLNHLADTGLLAMVQQRPFGKMADMAASPKSIFVTAVSTAPCHEDHDVLIGGREHYFSAGLQLLTKLTEGQVYLCMDGSSSLKDKFKNITGVVTHEISGLHPAGNASFHISQIDPMVPSDVVWVVGSAELVMIGQLFLDGKIPVEKIVALGGNGVKDSHRKHYRTRVGASYESLFADALEEGDTRIVHGDALGGKLDEASGSVHLNGSLITILPESTERRFMGWLAPGFSLRSFSQAFVSRWIDTDDKEYDLHTNRNGGHRAMVLTGYYDKVMPMDIMVDFLVRAVLAGDTTEAIKLGILETVPEDYALCEYICPCKMEIQTIIQDGLDQIEEEGF